MTRSATPSPAAPAGSLPASGPVGLVPNAYRAALAAARDLVTTADTAVAAVFDRVVVRLRGGAWEGRGAETWFGELRRARADADGAFDTCRQACERAWGAQPAEVDPDDWRAAFDAEAGASAAAGALAADALAAGVPPADGTLAAGGRPTASGPSPVDSPPPDGDPAGAEAAARPGGA